MAQAKLELLADSRQVRTATSDLERLNKSGQATEAVAGTIRRAFVALGTVLSVRQIVQYGDAYTGIQNRLRIVTESTEELISVQQRLLQVANDSRSEFATTVGLYSTLARSTEELGLSQDRLLRVTETINKAFAASGADALTAAGAIRQLGQGLASGALRGDEFNSVAEGAPEIMRAIAQQTGLTIGELREFAAQGKITSELLIASLENYGDTVDEIFGNSQRTFNQSLQEANNNLTQFIGSSRAVQGSLSGIGDALVAVTANLDEIDKFGISLAAGLTKSAIAIEGQFKLLGEGAKLALTLPFFEARNSAADFIQFLVDIGEPVREALGFGGMFDGLSANLQALQTDVVAGYRTATGAIREETQAALDQADDIYGDMFASVGAAAQATGVSVATSLNTPIVKGATESYTKLSQALSEQVIQLSLSEAAYARHNALVKLGADATDDERASVLSLVDAIEALRIKREQERAAEQTTEQFAGVQQGIAADIGGEAEQARQQLQARLDVIREYAAIEGADREAAMQAQLDAEQAFQQRLTEIRAQEEATRIQGLQNQLGAASQFFGDLNQLANNFGDEQNKINKALFVAQKAFSIAQSIIAIQTGIAQAAALPFPANLGAMATVAGATAGIVNTIQGVQAPRAVGGQVLGGNQYLVGERGPELVTMRGNGNVTPFNQLMRESGGGSNVQVSVNVQNYSGAEVKTQTRSETLSNGQRREILDIIVGDITQRGRVHSAITSTTTAGGRVD